MWPVSFFIRHAQLIVFTKSSQKISTHLLIMEVDFCPVLCIAKMPILQAFWAISHFVWYHSLSSNELQMV